MGRDRACGAAWARGEGNHMRESPNRRLLSTSHGAALKASLDAIAGAAGRSAHSEPVAWLANRDGTRAAFPGG
jgi:hypothetical protein